MKMKLTKKNLIILGAIGIILSISLNIYFGIVKVREGIYKKGLIQGQKLVDDAILLQLQKTNQLQLRIPQEDKSIKTIILVPEQ